MLHRTFLSIQIPESTKKTLLSYQEQWSDLPAKWTGAENLHLTLIFLGNTSDQELLEVITAIQRAVSKHQAFSLNLSSIVFGPLAAKPKMVWALIDESKELQSLHKDLEREFLETEKIAFTPENRAFSPHLTLARLHQTEIAQMQQEEIPEVNEQISLAIPVESIEIVESELKRTGPVYTTLQSIPLS